MAWRRTATALAVIGLLLGRTTLYGNAALAGAVARCGLGTTAWIAVHSDRRYRGAALAVSENAALPEGRAPFLCSALYLALGVLVLAVAST